MENTLQTLMTLAGGAVGLKVLEFGFGLIGKLVESKVEPEQSLQDRVSEMMFKRIEELTKEKNDELTRRVEAEKERDSWRHQYNVEFEKRVGAETKLELYKHFDLILDNIQKEHVPPTRNAKPKSPGTS